MSKRIIAFIVESTCVSLWAIHICWLFFRPVFWTLSGPVSSFEEGIKQVFFREDGQELLIGGGVDLIGTLWIFSNARSIFEGEQDTILSDIYAPVGFDLGMNTGFAWADAALSWPLMYFFDEPNFYNLHVFFTLLLSQIGIYILLRSWKTPMFIALTLMSFVVLNPFTMEEIYQGRPTQVHLFFHALFLWSISNVAKGKGWFWSILGAMTLAGSCLVYWFSGAAVGFCGLLLYFLFAKKPLFSLPKLFLLGGGAIAIILLTTWRVSKTFLLGTGKTQFAQLRRPSVSEIDLGIIEIPIQKWQYIMSFSDLNSMFSTLLIPSSIFLCALGSALICKKRFRTLLLILVTITIPIEGAIVFQYGTWFPTGYAFLHSIFPPLPRCTVPHRMMVSSLLIILLIIGWGSNTIVQNGKSIPTRILRMLIIFMGLYSLLQEQIPNMKQGNTSRHSKDRSYLQYTQQFPGGIIDVPLIASQKTYVQQRYHKQMIIGGPGQDSVRPQAHRRYYQKNTLLLALEGLAERGKGRSIREGDQQKLWDDGFRLIVVHLDMSNSRQESYEELLKTEGILDKKKNRLYIEIKPEK